MTRLYNLPTSKPVIGYNDETGYTMAEKATHIDADTAWQMWHEGTADLTPDAREQIKRDVGNGGSK